MDDHESFKSHFSPSKLALDGPGSPVQPPLLAAQFNLSFTLYNEQKREEEEIDRERTARDTLDMKKVYSRRKSSPPTHPTQPVPIFMGQ